LPGAARRCAIILTINDFGRPDAVALFIQNINPIKRHNPVRSLWRLQAERVSPIIDPRSCFGLSSAPEQALTPFVRPNTGGFVAQLAGKRREPIPQ
jgi:hypothetical protein